MSAAGSALVDEGVSGAGNGSEEYFPSSVYPTQGSGSWWESTNWFRSHTAQPSNQPPAPSLSTAASASPPSDAALRPAFRLEHGDVVEYSGVDDAVSAAYRAHILKQTPVQQQTAAASAAITDAPGHASCFNRFTITKTASAASSSSSTVSAVAPSKRQLLVDAAQGYAPSVIRQLQEYILLPLLQPSLFTTLGVQTSRGLLLSGQSGAGKSRLIHAMVSQLGFHFHALDGAMLAAGDGQGEDGRLTVVDRAFASARKHAPALIFIDELDAIAAERRPADSAMLHRLRAALRQRMDELSLQPPLLPVVVVGATSSPSSLCPSFRRQGRFEREIILNKPDAEGRKRILQQLIKGMKTGEELDLTAIAKATDGFVGSDLMALCREAGLQCIREALTEQRRRNRGQVTADRAADDAVEEGDELYGLPPALDPQLLSSVSVRQSHFLSAVPLIRPSSSRAFASDVAPASWSALGGNDEARSSLTDSISLPLLHGRLFRHFRLSPASSTLLYGPPGGGKTLMARIIASTFSVAFVSVKGPELLSSYLGESERKVRELFAQARAASPCVIFFDEIDAVTIRRGGGSDPTIDRVINQMLIEMDGVHSASTAASASAAPEPPLVFVIAATNRPELLDPAFLRPGRFDHLLFVPLPSHADRIAILRACMHDTPVAAPLSDEQHLAELSTRMEGWSGADIAGVVNTARRLAVREELETRSRQEGRGQQGEEAAATAACAGVVTAAHVEEALRSSRPSVTEEMMERYAYFQQVMCRTGESRRGQQEEQDDSEQQQEESDEKEGQDTLQAIRGRVRAAVAREVQAGASPQQALNAVLRGFLSQEQIAQSRGGREKRRAQAKDENEEEEKLPALEATARKQQRPASQSLTRH